MMWRKLRKTLFIGLVITGSIPIGMVAIAQTKWFKKQLESGLTEFARENGFSLSVGSIEGSLPLQWKLSNLVIEKKDALTVSVEEVKVRVAFFPIFRKKVVVSYLKTSAIDVIDSSLTEGTTATDLTVAPAAYLFSLPFDLSFSSFHIEKLTIIRKDTPLELSAQGSFLIKKCAKKIAIELYLHDLQKGGWLEFFADGGSASGHLAIQAHAALPIDELPSPLKSRIPNLPLRLSCDVDGPWATWENLLETSMQCVPPPPGMPIQGIVHAALGSSDAKATLSLYNDQILEGEFVLEIPDLASFTTPALDQIYGGELKGYGSLQKGRLQLNFDVKNASMGPLQFASWKNTLLAQQQENIWKGTWTSNAATKEAEASLATDFSFSPLDRSLQLTKMELLAPQLSAGGEATIALSPFSATGDLLFSAQDLHSLQPFLPSFHLAGACGGSVHIGDKIILHLLAHDLEWKNLHIGCGNLHADFSDFFVHPHGNIDFEAERVYFTNSYFSSLHFQAKSNLAGSWPFSVQTEGTWKTPFHLSLDACYQQNNDTHAISIEKLEGTLFEKPVHLEKTMTVTRSPNGIDLHECALKIGDGLLEGSFHKNISQFTLDLHGDKLPISWFTMYTPYLSLEGESTLDCHLIGTSKTLQGLCRLDITRFQALKRGDALPFYAKGTLEARIAEESLQIHSLFQASEQQVMMLHLFLPFSYEMAPFSLHLAQERPISGALEIEGKLEELFHFANTGTQTLSGWAAGKLLLFGTLKKPELQGTIALEQVNYEHHYAGFGVYNVETTLHAEKGKLVAHQLSAQDNHQGYLRGQGEIELDSERHFPYRVIGNFDHFEAINLDLVQATLSGPATLVGNMCEAHLQGTLVVDAAKATIPKSLPSDLPNLPYTFSEESPSNTPPLTTAFPFAIDLSFTADNTISFEGNGLSSTWGGNFHLHGVNLHLLASGGLRLSKGQFQILGKTFTLQQGELTFSDKPGHEGYLNLSGALTLRDATIMAQLRGPLSSPQLSFYSMPALTTNEIFSLLLFNKRVSEIKPVQAVQLAHTLLTFYGHTGWNPVSQIGKGLSTLGIDTFDIVPSEEGLKQSSVTIGKHFYLVRNLLVTLTQSRDSRRFMVEVDIGKGLLFQAENQSGPEQSQQEGKFSLKWNKNY